MAVLLLRLNSASDVRVKDLVIHSAAYLSVSGAVGSIYISSPRRDDGGVF